MGRVATVARNGCPTDRAVLPDRSRRLPDSREYPPGPEALPEHHHGDMNDDAPIRILVADDHPVVRGGLVALLRTIPDLEVVGEVSDGDAAVREVHLLGPDVVLMDVRMPGLDGVEATRRIRSGVPGTRVLILTMYDDDATVFTAMQAGAQGYLLKEAEQAEIVRAIRAVVAGDAIFGPGVAERVLSYFADPPAEIRHVVPLPGTDRAGADDARAPGPWSRHAGDRGRAVPLAQDGQQQPDRRLRQAPGRRPGRGDHPGPRTRGGRIRVNEHLALVVTTLPAVTLGAGVRRCGLPGPGRLGWRRWSPRCCWSRAWLPSGPGSETLGRVVFVGALELPGALSLMLYPRVRRHHAVDFCCLVLVIGAGALGHGVRQREVRSAGPWWSSSR